MSLVGYINTFIAVAEDCRATIAVPPVLKGRETDRGKRPVRHADWHAWPMDPGGCPVRLLARCPRPRRPRRRGVGTAARGVGLAAAGVLARLAAAQGVGVGVALPRRGPHHPPRRRLRRIRSAPQRSQPHPAPSDAVRSVTPLSSRCTAGSVSGTTCEPCPRGRKRRERSPAGRAVGARSGAAGRPLLGLCP
jgi:hypothetical protein